MERVQPVHGIPALSCGDAVAVADLHIGLETHLMRMGFHIVSRTEDMLETLIGLSENHSELIVLGDVKDSVPGRSKQEFVEIPGFFETLLEHYDRIDVVRGNHDTGLQDFLPDGVLLRPATGIVRDGIGFVHGHVWPSSKVMLSELLVMAHEHPAVMFMDGVGKRMTEPCWMRGPVVHDAGRYSELPRELVVVPAFNRLLGGSPVNAAEGKFLSPVLSNGMADLEKCRLYLLDGVYLGLRPSLLVAEKKARGGKKRPAPE